MDKATNFKFCMRILSIDQNNSPLKISGAVAGCVVKCTHILGASRGLLCDSYAVLSNFLVTFLVSVAVGSYTVFRFNIVIVCS